MEEQTDPVRALAQQQARARRRRRVPVRRRLVRRFGAVLGVAVLLGGPVALSPTSISEADSVGGDDALPPIGARLAAMRAGEGPTEADAAPAPTVFAEHDGVELVLPADEVRVVAYHEAAFDDALGLTPVGELVANENATKFDPPAASAGPGYVVMSSRGRPTPATSAVDIALEPDAPVTSVVSGEVTHTESYLLYGRHRDARIEIAPAGRPDLRVVIIHVGELRVAEGDEVVAGETVLATRSTHFSFHSQVDRLLDDPAGPHVHVEVKAHDPGDA